MKRVNKNKRRKRFTKLISLLLALLMLLGGMTFAAAETAEEMRIVCMAPSMVECVYALGMGDKIVGWSA